MKTKKTDPALIRVIRVFATVSIVALIVFLLLPMLSCKQKAPQFETFEVKKGNITQTVSTTGYIDSTEQKNYSVVVSGRVEKSLEEGDRFKKGETIFKVDNRKLNLLVQQAEENLKLAKSSLQLAKISYQQALDSNHVAIQLAELNQELSRQATESALTALEDANRYLKEVKEYEFSTDPQIAQAISQVNSAEGAYKQSITNQSITYWNNLNTTESAKSQIETTRQNIEQAEIQLKVSEINLELAKLDLENTTIIAPFDGIVLSSNFKEGEYNTPGVTAISIIKQEFVIKADINETDIAKLKVGQEVSFTLDAFYGEEFSGRIIKISPISKNVGGVVSFEITIKPENVESSKLMYGLSTNLTIVTQETENVLLVPLDALYEENGAKYVEILKEDGSIEKVKVNTGVSDYEFIEIKSGLKDGDIVIIPKVEETVGIIGRSQ